MAELPRLPETGYVKTGSVCSALVLSLSIINFLHILEKDVERIVFDCQLFLRPQPVPHSEHCTINRRPKHKDVRPCSCKGPAGFAHFYGDLIFSSVASIKFHGSASSENQAIPYGRS